MSGLEVEASAENPSRARVGYERGRKEREFDLPAKNAQAGSERAMKTYAVSAPGRMRAMIPSDYEWAPLFRLLRRQQAGDKITEKVN